MRLTEREAEGLLRSVVVTMDRWLVFGVKLLAGEPFFESSSASSNIAERFLSRRDFRITGLFSLCSEILILVDRRGSFFESGLSLVTIASFTAATTRAGFRPGEDFLAGEAFRAGDAFLAGEAFRFGDTLRAGDGFLAGDFFDRAGEALRPGDDFLAGGDALLFRVADFRPRLAVSAGPGTTAAVDTEDVAGPPPLVARRLSIPDLITALLVTQSVFTNLSQYPIKNIL